MKIIVILPVEINKKTCNTMRAGLLAKHTGLPRNFANNAL